MCGFLGVLDRQGEEIDLRGLEPRITRQLLQRGPDVCKAERAPGRYLAHSRLSITDESSAADQPFTNPTGDIVLLFNGEIYNYQTLRARLADYPFRTISDTEVIGRLYELGGEGALDQLDGTFALAIVDLRRQILILARDAVGKKPLFHCERGEQIAFSSDSSLIGSLFQTPLESSALGYYLRNGFPCPTQSLFKGVEPVRPGEVLTFALDSPGKEIDRRWLRPPTTTTDEDEDVATQAESAVRRAVEKRSSNVRRPVLFFSGGLDSTLVAKFLKEQFDAVDALTFKSVLPWELDYPYAKAAAKRYGLTLRPVSYPIRNLSDHLEELVSRQDEPVGVLSFVPLAFMSDVARASSKIVFTGDGGDEVFYGYDSISLWTDKNGKGEQSEMTSGPPLPHWVGDKGRRQATESLVGHSFARLDRAVSELGLEARCPLCDYSLMNLMRRQPRERVLSTPKQIVKQILAKDLPQSFVGRAKIGFATRIKYYQGLDGFRFIRSHLTPAFRTFLTNHGHPTPEGTWPPSAATVFRGFPGYWNLASLSAFLSRERFL